MLNSLILSIPLLLQQQDDDYWLQMILISCLFIFMVVATIVTLIGYWKVYTKAGHPGWACLIPFYNVYILLEIVGRPWWWLLLLFIPFANIVIWLLICIDLAKSFGKDVLLYGIILLFVLNGIGFLILGFGDAKYQGPAARQL